MRKVIGAAIAVLATGSVAAAGSSPKLGVPMTPAAVAAFDISIFPDGRGLPPGKGTVKAGRAVYDAQCAKCHGAGGRGATAEELAGSTSPLDGPDPDKTIGTYWPYATTIFDMTKRSMPMQAPGSLTDDEVYAVTAYLLYANKIIAEDFEINATTLPQVQMPNRNGFDRIDAK
jgi:S-disulfanyl-L-cysteine oxidoreductase SoxD